MKTISLKTKGKPIYEIIIEILVHGKKFEMCNFIIFGFIT